MRDALEALSYTKWGIFRASDAYNTLRDHQFDHKVIKDDKNSSEDQSKDPKEADKVETEPERWVKAKGALGKVADRLFSPSFSKLLTLLSIPVMILFAPGIFGIIGAVVALLMLGYNATREVMSYRKLRHLKEERGLLEAIEYYKGLNEEHDNSVGLTGIESGKENTKPNQLAEQTGVTSTNTSIPALQSFTPPEKIVPSSRQGASDGVEEKKPSKLAILGRSFLRRAPESTVAIAAAAVSGNPIALGLAVGGAITGFGATASQTLAYEKMKYQLINHNQAVASRAGITYNNRDELVSELNHQLNKFRKNNPELASHVQENVSLGHEPSFFADAGRIFIEGFSWSKNCRNFTPMVNDYGKQFLTPVPFSSSTGASVAPAIQYSKDHAQKVTQRKGVAPSASQSPESEVTGASAAG